MTDPRAIKVRAPEQPTEAAGDPTLTHKRPDIQGLRAIAVLMVVANHLWGWPRGGFVGVDVFFVISGFLITGLLLRECEKTGRISFTQFYARRVRRIMPAALTALGVTAAATGLLYSAARAKDVLSDDVWAALFAANWHFAIIGTDYFQNDSVSPVQHYWSLSVEEQFYVFWPMIILIGMRLTSGRRRRLEVLGAAVAALIAVSFGYSMWHTATSPTWAYFSTFDRAWELAVGALAAIMSGHLARLPRRAAAMLGWVGLLGIVASMFLIRDTMPFPAPWASLPALSAVAVIAAGIGGDQRTLIPLVNPVARYVGDISYSLYLWHFPVLMLLLAVFPDRGVTYSLIALGLIAVSSVLSYQMIEQPVLRSNWLVPHGKRRPTERRPWLAPSWMALVLVVAVLLVVATHHDATPARSAVRPLEKSLGDSSTLTEIQQARVTAALRATKFPALDLDRLSFAEWLKEITRSGCADVPVGTASDCVFGAPTGSARKHLTVLGDSFGMTWVPGIRRAFADTDTSIQQLTLSQCPAWGVPVEKGAGEAYPECEAWHSWALDQIEQSKPDLVVIANAYVMIDNLASRTSSQAAAQEAAAGFAKTIEAIERSGSKVVVLGAPPIVGSLHECVTRFASPADCSSVINDTWELVTDMERSTAAEAGASYISVRRWFCDKAGRCPGFVGGTPVTVDGEHLSIAYSRELAPLLAETLQPLLTEH